MKDVSISFIPGTRQPHIDMFMKLIEPLQERFRITIVPQGGEFLIATPSIYYKMSAENWKFFIEESKKSCTIMYSFVECIQPNFTWFDYYIGFHEPADFDRIIRAPYYMEDRKKLANTKKQVDEILQEKTGFCNFIYSNAQADPLRDQIFHALCGYKKVDALGKHLHNAESTVISPRYGGDWFLGSIEMKKPYKFSIAIENAVSSGYASEKIVSSMLGNTIPIYYGDPNISEKYNPKSFIDCRKFDSLDSLVEFVSYLDSNDDAYKKMMAEPWITPEQVRKDEDEVKSFLAAVATMFEKKERRRSNGPINEYDIELWQHIPNSINLEKNVATPPTIKKDEKQPIDEDMMRVIRAGVRSLKRKRNYYRFIANFFVGKRRRKYSNKKKAYSTLIDKANKTFK